MGWLRRGMNFQRCPNVIGPASWRAKTCGADFYTNGPVTNFASRRRGSRTAPSSFLSLRFLIGERARTFHISAYPNGVVLTWVCVICFTEERFDPAHTSEVGWGRF